MITDYLDRICVNELSSPPKFKKLKFGANSPKPPNGRKGGCYCDGTQMAYRACPNLAHHPNNWRAKQWRQEQCIPDKKTCISKYNNQLQKIS